MIVGRCRRTVQQKMVFTPRAKRVIELASEEAHRQNDKYIGTEHLLIGIIREGEGMAADVLMSLGVHPAKLGTKAAVRPDPAKWCADLAATLKSMLPVVDELEHLAMRVLIAAALVAPLFHEVIRH
jgi:ATP-dependent Clp protease ATP-binding subunit ClpC